MSKIIYPNNYPQEYKPLGAWAYFGLNILYNIPIVGFIVAIVIAIAGENVHMKNHAKASIIMIIFSFVIAILYILLLGMLVANQIL